MRWYLKKTESGLLAFREDTVYDSSKFDGLLPNEYNVSDLKRIKLVSRAQPDENGFLFDVIVDNIKERDIIQSVEDEKWERIQDAVNQLLASTDWTQTADAPLDAQTKTDYTNYRTYLRGFVGQVTDINTASVQTFDQWKTP